MKIMTRVEALAIIIGYIESEENDSHWERLTEDYADDDDGPVPGLADVLKTLGATDAEIEEAWRRA